jgi:hypothetical protein
LKISSSIIFLWKADELEYMMSNKIEFNVDPHPLNGGGVCVSNCTEVFELRDKKMATVIVDQVSCMRPAWQ